MEFKPIASRKSGFTLTEMFVALCLATVLILGVVSIYSFSLTSFVSMSNYTELNQSSRAASDLISRDVRNASSVDSTSTSNQLVLNIYDGSKVTYAFDASGKTLNRVAGTETNTLLKGI